MFSDFLRKLKLDGFVASIFLAVLFAWAFPSFGGNASPLPLGLMGKTGVWLIFFFYGLKLGPDKLLPGLKNWKLHLLIQGSTFLLFPIVSIPVALLFPGPEPSLIRLGFLFLAALPSTVSSSVVLVSMAKGNVPAALFNASISGLIGVGVTPLWLRLAGDFSSSQLPLSIVYQDLAMGILLPVGLGLALQKWLGKYVRTYASFLANFDKSVILLIIFHSFAQSFDNHLFNTVSIGNLAGISVACLGLFWILFYLTGKLSDGLNFNAEDRIAAQFCGSKKSLVHGTVFAGILFPEVQNMGLVLLPLLIYHALQLILIGAMAENLGNRSSLQAASGDTYPK